MKLDKRIIWKYRGCKIIPIDCQHPTWGKCGTPRNFGEGNGVSIVRNRYWRIDFPDNTWIFSATKKSCIEYINMPRNDHRFTA